MNQYIEKLEITEEDIKNERIYKVVIKPHKLFDNIFIMTNLDAYYIAVFGSNRANEEEIRKYWKTDKDKFRRLKHTIYVTKMFER